MKPLKFVLVVLLTLSGQALSEEEGEKDVGVETPKETETTVRTEDVEIKLPNGEIAIGRKKTTYYTTKWNTTYTYASRPVLTTYIPGQEATKYYTVTAGQSLPLKTPSTVSSPTKFTYLEEGGSEVLASENLKLPDGQNVYLITGSENSKSYVDSGIGSGKLQAQFQGPASTFSYAPSPPMIQQSFQSGINQELGAPHKNSGSNIQNVQHQPVMWQEQAGLQHLVISHSHINGMDIGKTTAEPFGESPPTIDPIYIRTGIQKPDNEPLQVNQGKTKMEQNSFSPWSGENHASVVHPVKDSQKSGIYSTLGSTPSVNWKEEAPTEIDWRNQAELSSEGASTTRTIASQQPAATSRPVERVPSSSASYSPSNSAGNLPQPHIPSKLLPESKGSEGKVPHLLQHLNPPSRQKLAERPPEAKKPQWSQSSTYILPKVAVIPTGSFDQGAKKIPPPNYTPPNSAFKYAGHTTSSPSSNPKTTTSKYQEDNFDEFSQYDEDETVSDGRENISALTSAGLNQARPASSAQHTETLKRPAPTGQPWSERQRKPSESAHDLSVEKEPDGAYEKDRNEEGSWGERNRPRPGGQHRPRPPPSKDDDYETSGYYDKRAYKCPALDYSSPGTDIKCMTRYYDVTACSEPQPVGTKATYTCKRYYESSTGKHSMMRKCKADGTWSGSRDRFNCILECGKANLIKAPLITNGVAAVRSQWPWNVATFYQTTQREWTLICGGTLITESAVLTAAHCVTYAESSEVRNERLFRLEFGKYKRTEVDENVQSRYVSKIVVHDSYSPYGFDSDIAILILEKPVEVGYHVRPVCYLASSDSDLEEIHLSEQSLGTVVGWGKTESGELSDRLNIVRLPVVSRRDCLENFQDAMTTQLQTRSTTYCAGFRNGTNVCSGDSGAGMYFPANTINSVRWYIQGIVSVGIPDKERNCDPTKYSVFTRVGRYAEWISKILSQEEEAS